MSVCFLPPFHTFMSWRVHLLLCTYGWKDVEWNELNWASCNSCLLLHNKLSHFNKINDEVMLRKNRVEKFVYKNLNNFHENIFKIKLHSKVIKIYWQSDKKYRITPYSLVLHIMRIDRKIFPTLYSILCRGGGGEKKNFILFSFRGFHKQSTSSS